MGGSCGAWTSSVITLNEQNRLSGESPPEENINLTGARIKIPLKGILASRRPLTSSGASKDSTYVCACCKKVNTLSSLLAQQKGGGGGNDDVTCDPQPFLIVVTETPPKSSCPPFFGFDTACESSIAPAQVPHTAFVLTNSRRGSINPDRRASNAMVVDSGSWGRVFRTARGVVEDGQTNEPPPGMIKASHRFSSSGVRTWITSRWPFPELFCSIA